MPRDIGLDGLRRLTNVGHPSRIIRKETRMPRKSMPSERSLELAREQSISELEQAIADREQLVGDRDQLRIDQEQLQHDQQREGTTTTGDKPPEPILDDRQARIDREQ